MKNTENLQLKSHQQRAINYTSVSSINDYDEGQFSTNGNGGGAVDEICEKLFENLEEYWEIKNTIDEIIKLNEISSTHIQERTRLLDSRSLS